MRVWTEAGWTKRTQAWVTAAVTPFHWVSCVLGNAIVKKNEKTNSTGCFSDCKERAVKGSNRCQCRETNDRSPLSKKEITDFGCLVKNEGPGVKLGPHKQEQIVTGTRNMFSQHRTSLINHSTSMEKMKRRLKYLWMFPEGRDDSLPCHIISVKFYSCSGGFSSKKTSVIMYHQEQLRNHVSSRTLASTSIIKNISIYHQEHQRNLVISA